MDKLRFRYLFCWFLLPALAFSPANALAKNKADIADIVVSRGERNIEVSFRIQNCFTPKMEEAIRSGVPTTFRIRVVLEEDGPPLFRTQLADMDLDHTIKYDRLRNCFRLQLTDHTEKELLLSDFEEAKRYMSTVENLPVIPLWRLDKNETYRLRVKAELSKIRLPFFFHYIFFFVSLWDFETHWSSITL